MVEELKANFIVYTFTIYNYNHRLPELEEKFNYQYSNNFKVYPPATLESIHQAMKALGIKYYEIRVIDVKETWREPVVFISPEIVAIRDRQEKEVNMFIESMKKKAEEFNNLPEILNTWFFDEFSIKLVRSNANYEPKVSLHKLGGYVTFVLFKDDKEIEDGNRKDGNRIDWEITDCISEDGKLLRKKWMKRYHSGMTEEISNFVMDKILEMVKYKKEFEQKWSLC